MPSLRQIRYFLAVADQGGFTPAAEILHIAQPALSRQVALLEAELGFPLFRREPRGVALTEAGQLFRQRMGSLEESLHSAADDARRLHHGEGGVLRLLHSSSTPVAGALLQALSTFASSHPGVRVDLDRLSSELQLEALAQGRADLGLGRLPLLRREAAVTVRPLAEEALWAALPADHALTARTVLALEALAEEPFVFGVHRERGGLARRVTDLCLSRGFTPRLAPVTSRKTAMLQLVAAGFGIAIVPASMAALGAPGVAFRPLADADTRTQAALFLPLHPSPLAEAFAATLAARWAAAG